MRDNKYNIIKIKKKAVSVILILIITIIYNEEYVK